MSIRKVIIKNYKQFKNIEIEFNTDINIIVGDNEAGKSTLFEAINLALTSKINGRPLIQELTPYLFNAEVVKNYIDELQNNPKAKLPEILIEIYFNENEELQKFRGSNNSKQEDAIGVCLKIKFDTNFGEEYNHYISKKENVTTVSVEYYSCEWLSFASSGFKFTQLPIKSLLIDNIEHKFMNGPDRYISYLLEDTLEKNENAILSLKYRKLKEDFIDDESIKKINNKITELNDKVTEKDLKISVDVSARSSWDANLSLYLNGIPFKFIGKGEQNSIKTKLALKTKAEKAKIILIEEPETSLSYSNMNRLISYIKENCCDKQIFISTHSSYVMNKSGIDKTIILNKAQHLKLNDLTSDTYEYFKKLPGYDTLRLILSKSAFLVEGPSDELIVQKAYLKKYGKLPIDDGIDVISVHGLSFLRFIEIAFQINKKVTVFTDNDGNYTKLEEKYKDYTENENIKIQYSKNNLLRTLEPQITDINEVDDLCNVLGLNKEHYNSKEKITEWMINNKTDSALSIFLDNDNQINFPEYIVNAI